MNTSYLTSIIEEAWGRAIKANDYATWRSLAEMASQLADAVEYNDPDNIMAAAHHGVYLKAYERMLAMNPKEVDA